eukprot:scaffold13664_cov30-Prasinocladus_malaysianus.AAC.1
MFTNLHHVASSQGRRLPGTQQRDLMSAIKKEDAALTGHLKSLRASVKSEDRQLPSKCNIYAIGRSVLLKV